MKKFTVLLLVFIGSYLSSKATTCTAIASGFWDVGSTWSCGSMPTCGDTIVIPSTFTVTVENQIAYACVGGMILTIGGELNFVTGKKLALPCNSAVILLPGGTINPGSGGGSSNTLSICGTNVWIAGQGQISGPLYLPIKLLYFNATYSSVNNNVNLEWSTASEINNKEFTVQKSTDGTNWEDVVTVPGAGNSDKTLYYNATDEDPYAGVSYYQLKQTDFDGHSTVAQQVTVTVPHGLLASAYPNPCTGNAVLQYNAASSKIVTITVMDISGRETASYTFQPGISNGLNSYNLNLTGLSPGVYLIRVQTAISSSVLRIVKVSW